MDRATQDRRAETARLLKAARWLCASVQPSGNRSEESVEWKLRELSAADLAARSPLHENGWSAKRIGRIERMERDVKPIEMNMLERALGLPGLFDAVMPRHPLDPPAELTRSPEDRGPTSVQLPPLRSRRVEGPSAGGR
jgi:hypothetical protein